MDGSDDSEATRLMTKGGDPRLDLDPATGRNRYHSAPRPSPDLAYASSTANDISEAAFDRVRRLVPHSGDGLAAGAYRDRLEALRARIRGAWSVPAEIDIVFAPSGTDLEYVALAAVAGRARRGTHNLLLGADEVGSGCIHSAHGRYFAESTALGVVTEAGRPVRGLGDTQVEMVDVPVRDSRGRARPSALIAEEMDGSIAAAAATGRHALVHVVHGSKTGLILPSGADVAQLQRRHGEAASVVVDACQARITAAAVGDYLAQGAIVLATGSKFMGGPPFSGFALVPRRYRHRAQPLPEGFATIFRRAEWPVEWPGADRLADGANPGLLLRLEASIFELERFQALPAGAAARVIVAFHKAVRDGIVETTPARRVAPYPPGGKETAETHPIEMRSLSTLDLSGFSGGGATFEDATRWYRALLTHGVRLGQPVKCVKRADGGWGATLRIGLSMPQVVERAGLADPALAAAFAQDMARIAEALRTVTAAG
jgi:selenocysteine lyase/cysteine desulfurase